MTLDTLAAATVIATAIPITLSYIYNCYARPFRSHRRCNGTGHIPYLFGRGWRFCLRCQATGLRLRLGRRAWNHLRRLQREAALADDNQQAEADGGR
ncbi:hypothetical protein ACNF49_40725 [Actinomadura sp. ATCC 39365]